MLWEGDPDTSGYVFGVLAAVGGYTPKEIGEMTFTQQLFICSSLETRYGLASLPPGAVRVLPTLADYNAAKARGEF